ncbi:hypothetical protein BD779DRAFT_1806845 [Infundibulicybe gibba]|nr:hypothetical protein BD779DRAFT_1806845 [Infundibulicybe gibba]
MPQDTTAVTSAALGLPSPPKSSPSKLLAYLKYAEEHLGIAHVTNYENLLLHEGYGPDILPYIDEKSLILCGLTASDTICLKSPLPNEGPADGQLEPDPEATPSALKRDGTIVGVHLWWFYNEVTKSTEKVPNGFIPNRDPAFLSDPDAPSCESSPSPERNAETDEPGDGFVL